MVTPQITLYANIDFCTIDGLSQRIDATTANEGNRRLRQPKEEIYCLKLNYP